jgi:hypothetical protein
MKYAASSEATTDVDNAIEKVHRGLDPVLADAIKASKLASVDGTLIYVPIVMPIEMHEKYKERSRYVGRTRTYECCPHLKYEVFLHGSLEEVFDEYLRGLASAAPHLQRLGATEAQSAEFLSILDQARARALAERRDITRQ